MSEDSNSPTPGDSNDRWWYRTPAGEVYGPYTQDELRVYTAAGRIDFTGTLRQGEGGDWVDPRTIPMIASLGADGPPPVAPPTSPSPPVADTGVASISRGTYIMLALLPFLLLGLPGIHNLVLGRAAIGLSQLFLSLILLWGFGCVGSTVMGIGPLFAIPTWILLLVWTIVDVATVTADGDGRPFAR